MQGIRQASAFCNLLQAPHTSSGGGGMNMNVHQLTDLTLATIGRILECSLECKDDNHRYTALRSVASAMAQVLVGTGMQPLMPQQQETSEIAKEQQSVLTDAIKDISSEDDTYGDWGAHSIKSLHTLLSGTNKNGFDYPKTNSDYKDPNLDLNTPITLGTLYQMALNIPTVDRITGQKSSLLQNVQHSDGDISAIGQSHAAYTAYLMLNDQVNNNIQNSLN